MKWGWWFLPGIAVAMVGVLFAEALPVPPSLPRSRTETAPSSPAAVAVAPVIVPPAPTQAAAVTPAPAPIAATVPPQAPPAPAAIQTAGAPLQTVPAPPGAAIGTWALPEPPAQKPARRLAKPTPQRHHQTVAQIVRPHYRAVVPAPPPGPYPGMPVPSPTQIAMQPPPYGMPAPYWRAPYPPY